MILILIAPCAPVVDLCQRSLLFSVFAPISPVRMKDNVQGLRTRVVLRLQTASCVGLLDTTKFALCLLVALLKYVRIFYKQSNKLPADVLEVCILHLFIHIFFMEFKLTLKPIARFLIN